MADLNDDPQVRAWLDDAQKNLLPGVRESTIGVSLLPAGEPDAKIAVELGFLILLDKPIIAIRKPGAPMSRKLAAVIDYELQADLSTPEGKEIAQAFFASEEFAELIEWAAGRE